MDNPSIHPRKRNRPVSKCSARGPTPSLAGSRAKIPDATCNEFDTKPSNPAHKYFERREPGPRIQQQGREAPVSNQPFAGPERSNNRLPIANLPRPESNTPRPTDAP